MVTQARHCGNGVRLAPRASRYKMTRQGVNKFPCEKICARIPANNAQALPRARMRDMDSGKH